MARRLALARAGLLKPAGSGLTSLSNKNPRQIKNSAHQIVERFGYLQLDTVAVAGARSHSIVLQSRIDHLQPEHAEGLLKPGAPLFEYWGHEACWMPMAFYPVFQFRRQAYKTHPWWGDLLSAHPQIVDHLLRRIEQDGPLRSLHLDADLPLSTSTKIGNRTRAQQRISPPPKKETAGWWNHKLSKKVATALWSSGQLAISERTNFQRVFDLPERVIPKQLLTKRIDPSEALKLLLLRALAGHGWASASTLAQTWRLKNMRAEIKQALQELSEQEDILPCELTDQQNGKMSGWIRPVDLELAEQLKRIRPAAGHGVLLSPFDPLLWDRQRVMRLFNFVQLLEIFKPAAQRVYGYYCMPVLAGEALIARVDLKADQKRKTLHVLSCRYEATKNAIAGSATEEYAVTTALQRFASQISLTLNNHK